MKKRKTRKISASSIGNGWITTDAEEVERRRLRSMEESLTVKAVVSQSHKAGDIYTDYLVSSPGGSQYLVEYRHKSQRINSCNCPDYTINGLGTCKHIERVSRFLLRKKTPQKRHCTQVYVNVLNGSHVEVLWADSLRSNSKVKKLLAPYFSADNSLLNESIESFNVLYEHVCQAGLSPGQLKISANIIPWLQYLSAKKNATVERDVYLQDVADAKREKNIVKQPLYDYQYEGMLHLAFKGRAILADDMGLGKTVQAIAACELLRQLKGVQRVMIVSPVSLKTEWEEQIEKFTHLPGLLIQGNRANRLKLYQKRSFFYMANYEQLLYDSEEIQNVLMPDIIILDEAQRIKNWQTKTAQMVKRLKSPYLFVLTGTPLENKIDEIYSIAQVVDPHLLGPLFRFNRDFYQFDEQGKATGYRQLDKLHHRLRPILLRRRKDQVEGELPERINNTYFVSMHKEQFLRYDEYKAKLARLLHFAKKRPLRPEEYKRLQMCLACMRMLCDTPYILDQECRISPKLDELKNILSEQLEDKQNKIIIFSEWTKMLDLIREHLESLGIAYALHTGQVHQKKRRVEINRFKNDPECRLFLSSDAGATGLNLQVANIVINMDLPWNPAKLEQRIARAWRKHQKRQVHVINLVCESSIEHRMMSILAQKSLLAKGVIDGDGEPDMDLPSGRKIMIERLEEVMGGPAVFNSAVNDENKTPHDPVQDLYQEIEAQHPQSITHLSVHENDEGRQTVFTVVQSDADEHRRQIQDIADAQENTSAESSDINRDTIEVIDAETMATIQRLVDAGVLSFNSAKQSIVSSKNEQQQEEKQKQRWINRARKRFDEADRQFKMAELLFSGGFEQEAMTPLTAVLELVISCLYQSISGKIDAQVQLTVIETQLIAQFELPDELLIMLAGIREGSEKHQPQAIPLVKALLEKTDENLLSRSLS